MKILSDTALTFDDVLLKPRFSTIESRFAKEIDMGVDLTHNCRLKYPIISSNMDTVTEQSMAEAMSQLGGLGIIHRFMTPEIQRIQLLDADLNYRVGCIGIGKAGLHRLDTIGDICDAILIDIAHGHSKAAIKQVSNVKTLYPNMAVIAGNVATGYGVQALCDAGADCIKIGVGPGALCITRTQTGNGVPQLTAIMECASIARRLGKSSIADGGIRNSGDIIKALAAGADAVMIGSLLAGTNETPGRVFNDKKSRMGQYKVYRGMASREAQESWKGQAQSIEGEFARVPCTGAVEPLFNELIYAMLSGMSYQNARTLTQLRDNAIFIRQTTAGQQEANPHRLQ